MMRIRLLLCSLIVLCVSQVAFATIQCPTKTELSHAISLKSPVHDFVTDYYGYQLSSVTNNEQEHVLWTLYARFNSSTGDKQVLTDYLAQLNSAPVVQMNRATGDKFSIYRCLYGRDTAAVSIIATVLHYG